jgi:DNA-binding MarR family transcriptional regulator
MNNIPIGKGILPCKRPLPTKTSRYYAAFSASLQPFKDLSSAGSPLPFSIIIAFLAVASRDGAGAFQLGKDLGMSQGSLSRVLADLSDVNRNGGAGRGLVEQRSESTDRRIQTSRLTEKRKGMVRRIAAALKPVPVRVAA